MSAASELWNSAYPLVGPMMWLLLIGQYLLEQVPLCTLAGKAPIKQIKSSIYW